MRCASGRWIVLLVATTLLGLVHGCDPDKIQQCMNNTLGVENPLTFNPSNLVVLDDVCGSVLDDFKQCLKRSTSNCPSPDKIALEGLIKLYEFLCNDGRKDLLTHGQCLGRPITISKITSCQSTMESNINPDSSLEIRCRHVKVFLDCVKDEVEEECGSDAAAFEDKVVRLTVAPSAESRGCDIESGSGTSSISSGIIVWGIGFATLLQHPAGTSKDSDKCDSIKRF